jgi:hypothetical protein
VTDRRGTGHFLFSPYAASRDGKGEVLSTFVSSGFARLLSWPCCLTTRLFGLRTHPQRNP